MNQTFSRNLSAYLNRYPKDAARILPIVSQPTKYEFARDYTYEPFTSEQLEAMKPPPRTALLCGFLDPRYIQSILNDPLITSEMMFLIVVEQDQDFLAACFQYVEMSQLILCDRVEWFLGYNTDELKSAFFNTLKKPHFTCCMYSTQYFIPKGNSQENKDFYYNTVTALHREVVDHVIFNCGRIDDSLDGIKAVLRNKKRLISTPGIQDLKDKHKGQPVIVCGAGGALDNLLPVIKENENKAVIIAVDAALKPLLTAGIEPDYVAALERENLWQKAFYQGIDKKLNCPLVCFPVIHPEVLDVYPGPIKFVYRNYSWFAYFERSWPKTILPTGSSAGHLAHELAHYMGASEIILAGVDSCYTPDPENKDLFRSHCFNTGFPEWSVPKKLEEYDTKASHFNQFVAASNSDNENCWTNQLYFQWGKEHSLAAARFANKRKVYNASKKGLAFAGIDYIDLAEKVKNWQPIEKTKEISKSVVSLRKWDNSFIKQQVKNWNDLLNQIVDIAKPAELTSENLRLLDQFLLYKLENDALFTSFIVQCCAMEYYQCKNQLMQLELDYAKSMKERQYWLLQLALLYKQVTGKLLKILEEYDG